MWLTLLWQNKGLVVIGLCALVVAGLIAAVKVQSSRLDAAQAEVKLEREAKEIAIEAHDSLVSRWEKQKQVLSEREAARLQQEKDYAALRSDLKAALVFARVWADTPLPDGVLRTLQALPEVGPPAAPVNSDTRPGVRRPDQ